jgi:hypothetical protein
MKKLFDSGDPEDYSKLCWRIFANYLGSEDCGKLSLNDRVLVVELYKAVDKYLMKKWHEQDEQEEERERKEQLAKKLAIKPA